MSTLIGVVAIGLMVVVLIIAAASLLLLGGLPVAKLIERRRSRKSE